MPINKSSCPLPRPLVIPDVMQLRTLADVRELIEQHLPAYCGDKASWRVVAQGPEGSGAGRRSHRGFGCPAHGAIARGCRVPAEVTHRHFPPPFKESIRAPR